MFAYHNGSDADASLETVHLKVFERIDTMKSIVESQGCVKRVYLFFYFLVPCNLKFYHCLHKEMPW